MRCMYAETISITKMYCEIAHFFHHKVKTTGFQPVSFRVLRDPHCGGVVSKDYVDILGSAPPEQAPSKITRRIKRPNGELALREFHI